MPGIMSGLEPMKMQEGGDVDKGFFNLQRTAEGSGINLRDITDFIFDPTDPVDYAIAPLMLFPPAAIASKLLQMGVKGNKLRKTLEKTEKAKGLVLGPTRETYTGMAGQMAARQELADLVPHSKTSQLFGNPEYDYMITQSPLTGGELLSYEARDELRADPEYYKREGGLPELIDLVSEIEPKYLKNVVPEELLTELNIEPEEFYVYEDEPVQKADGGILSLAKGGRVAKKIAKEAKPKTRPKKVEEPKVKQEEPAPTTAKKVQEKADEAITKADEVKKAQGIPEGAAAQAAKPSMIKKAVKPALIGTGIVAGASLLPGGDKSDAKRPQEPSIRQDSDIEDITQTFDIDDIATSDKWANIMKYNLVQNQGFQVDDQGNFVEKPKFLDYLKALPSSYMDKVSRDTDFAKKMMAGFLNMMKPVEGYVPVNPVVAFGEGYLGEETRQAEMLPADARLLEYFKANPAEYAKMLELEGTRAGILEDVDAEKVQAQYELIKRSLMSGSGYGSDKYGDLEVYYKDEPMTPRDLAALQKQGIALFGDPNLILKPKPSGSS
jgi:hypothetical protein